MDMRCNRKILCISCIHGPCHQQQPTCLHWPQRTADDDVSIEVVHNIVSHNFGWHKDLLSVRRRKPTWHDHVTRSTATGLVSQQMQEKGRQAEKELDWQVTTSKNRQLRTWLPRSQRWRQKPELEQRRWTGQGLGEVNCHKVIFSRRCEVSMISSPN